MLGHCEQRAQLLSGQGGLLCQATTGYSPPGLPDDPRKSSCAFTEGDVQLPTQKLVLVPGCERLSTAALTALSLSARCIHSHTLLKPAPGFWHVLIGHVRNQCPNIRKRGTGARKIAQWAGHKPCKQEARVQSQTAGSSVHDQSNPSAPPSVSSPTQAKISKIKHLIRSRYFQHRWPFHFSRENFFSLSTCPK